MLFYSRFCWLGIDPEDEFGAVDFQDDMGFQDPMGSPLAPSPAKSNLDEYLLKTLYKTNDFIWFLWCNVLFFCNLYNYFLVVKLWYRETGGMSALNIADPLLDDDEVKIFNCKNVDIYVWFSCFCCCNFEKN